MEELKEYFVLRYSLVKEDQEDLHVKEIPSTKGKAILVALDGEREFKINGVTYSSLGFHALEPTHGYDYPRNRFYLGKIAKLKKQQTGEKIPGDVIEFEHDTWIPITVIFDVESQHIFVGKDWRFGTAEQIMKSIQAALTEPVLANYNHKVFVEGKSEPEKFWNLADEKNRIYRLEFKLISPNILDTNKKARDALESLKDIFGQEEIDISLKNETGGLKIPQEPVSDYLDYIAEGEGSWKMVAEGDRGGKKSYSSNEVVDTVNLPSVENEKFEGEDIEQLKLETENLKEPQKFEEANLGAEIYATVKDMGKN